MYFTTQPICKCQNIADWINIDTYDHYCDLCVLKLNKEERESIRDFKTGRDKLPGESVDVAHIVDTHS